MVNAFALGGLGKGIAEGLESQQLKAINARKLSQQDQIIEQGQQRIDLSEKTLAETGRGNSIRAAQGIIRTQLAEIQRIDKNSQTPPERRQNAGAMREAIKQLRTAQQSLVSMMLTDEQRASLGPQGVARIADQKMEQQLSQVVPAQGQQAAGQPTPGQQTPPGFTPIDHAGRGANAGVEAAAKAKAISNAAGGKQSEIIPVAEFNKKHGARLPLNAVIQRNNLSGEITVKAPGTPLIQIGGPRVDAEGNVTSGDSAGGASSASSKGGDVPALPGKALDDIRAQVNAVNTSITVTKSLIDEVRKHPQNFGLSGSVRKGVQTTGSVVADLFKFAKIDVRDAFDSTLKVLNLDDIEPAAKKALTPTTVGALQVFESQLTYAVARALQPSGKLLKDAVDSARKQVELTGLTGSTQVAERLEAVLPTLQSREADLLRRMQQGVQGSTNIPRASPLSDRTGGNENTGTPDVNSVINRLKSELGL